MREGAAGGVDLRHVPTNCRSAESSPIWRGVALSNNAKAEK
jgi:hypothetical protein